MSIIKLQDLYFKPFINQEEIAVIVKQLAVQVKADLPKGEVPLFVGILNGCFLFAADFIREFNGDCEVSFVKLASYEGIESSGIVSKLIGLNEDLKDRNIIIVEDIVDTGNTISSVFEKIKAHQPKSIEVTTLLFKPKVYNKNIPIKYPVINVGNEFLVGFGLDYNGIGRNLEDIYIIEEKN